MKQPEKLFETQITGLDTPVPRSLKHRRQFCFEVYEREDGLWDIDAQMQDHKTHEMILANEPRPAGDALHDMVMRVTCNDDFTIVDVDAKTLSAPYMRHCNIINPDYRKMIGLNFVNGFRNEMRNLFGGIEGCTHLTELANIMPTAVVQGVGAELAIRRRLHEKEAGLPSQKPFQLDKCHALSSDSEAVELYYPKWYTKSQNP